MTTSETWTAAARRLITRAERAEAAGDYKEAERLLDRANSFFTNSKEAAK
jgi:hypothetical protein